MLVKIQNLLQCKLSLNILIDAIRYSFGPLIQRELNVFADEWSNHRNHQSRMAERPSGVPHVLWHFPALHGMTIIIIIINDING